MILLTTIILSCKKNKGFPLPEEMKNTEYPVPEEMKEFFVFQKGSYWIYKNDSTNELDSSYVNYFGSLVDENGYPGKSREVNQMYFTSKFLYEYVLIYACFDGLTITTKIDTLSGEPITTGETIAYADSWKPNTNFSQNECGAYGIYWYNRLPNKIINNKAYQNIIYSKNVSIDSVSYIREIYFAKNVGVIKYFESSKYHKFQRSYSLIRHKVIQ